MSITSRLAVAVAVGLGAAGLNALALLLANRGGEYVAFSQDVGQGKPVTPDALTPLAVPGDPAVVGRSLVPWKDRGLLVQMSAPRGYAVGDLVLQRDVREAIRIASRDDLALLSFRVIAVGDRFKRQSGVDADRTSGGDGNFVTIAVTQDAKEAPREGEPRNVIDARRMVRVVTQRAAGGKPEAEDRILGVAVFPREEAGGAEADDAPIGQPRAGEMLLTVPLEGIESVPDVILVGGNIGFFMLPNYP